MALIKCSECGREISDRAAACPGCGCPVKNSTAPIVQQPAVYSAQPVQPIPNVQRTTVSSAQMGQALLNVSALSASDIIAEGGKGGNRKNRVRMIVFFLIAMGCWLVGMILLCMASSSDKSNGTLNSVSIVLLLVGILCVFVSIWNLSVYKETFIKVTANRIYGKTGNTFIDFPISMVTSVTTNAKNSIIISANNKTYKFKKLTNCGHIYNAINSLISSR